MNQYCRYCNNLYTGNGIYCAVKDKTMSEASTKRLNKCASFEFNPIDAYDLEHIYKPQNRRRTRLQNMMMKEFE